MTKLWILLSIAVLASACVVVAPANKPAGRSEVTRAGPPPHAPAHGYRHKLATQGVDLVFDSGLGVYVVVGLTDVYFYRDRFYRLRDARWYVSSKPRTDFVVVALRDLPPGLANERGRSKGKGRGKGREK